MLDALLNLAKANDNNNQTCLSSGQHTIDHNAINDMIHEMNESVENSIQQTQEFIDKLEKLDQAMEKMARGIKSYGDNLKTIKSGLSKCNEKQKKLIEILDPFATAH